MPKFIHSPVGWRQCMYGTQWQTKGPINPVVNAISRTFRNSSTIRYPNRRLSSYIPALDGASVESVSLCFHFFFFFFFFFILTRHVISPHSEKAESEIHEYYRSVLLQQHEQISHLPVLQFYNASLSKATKSGNDYQTINKRVHIEGLLPQFDSTSISPLCRKNPPHSITIYILIQFN